MDKAENTLNKFDWSAANADFQISIAAVRGDVSKVADFMTTKNEFKREIFHEWPVFRSIKDDPVFLKAYESAFGIEYLVGQLRVDIVKTEEDVSEVRADGVE